MIKNIDALVKSITDGIREFTDVAVVGMSGGADSTLVATLCTLALGKDNVHSLHMPYNQLDEKTFNSRSVSAAKKLGVHVHIVPITGIADAIIRTVQGAVKDVASLVNAGNARSRARMTALYGFSSHLHDITKRRDTRIRVIGTGNLSEDYIGYDTKGGDALCDLFPIGELFKSEVYQLLEYFRDQGIIDEAHIDRVPSAGLWDGQTDEQELGYTYNEMEPVIKGLMAQHTMKLSDPLVQFVMKRHTANKHKHLAPPTLPLRNFCE